ILGKPLPRVRGRRTDGDAGDLPRLLLEKHRVRAGLHDLALRTRRGLRPVFQVRAVCVLQLAVLQPEWLTPAYPDELSRIPACRTASDLAPAAVHGHIQLEQEH